MKKPRDVEDIGARLALAASKPLVPPSEPTPPQAAPVGVAPRTRRPGRPPLASSELTLTVPITLRVPLPKHEELTAEAVAETKQTGRGVSIQQIILRKLGV